MTLTIGNVDLSERPHRLICGTGKYADYEVMQKALDASGCKVVTVAVRRERLVDAQGRSLLVHTPSYGAGPEGRHEEHEGGSKKHEGCWSSHFPLRVLRGPFVSFVLNFRSPR